MKLQYSDESDYGESNKINNGNPRKGDYDEDYEDVEDLRRRR